MKVQSNTPLLKHIHWAQRIAGGVTFLVTLGLLHWLAEAGARAGWYAHEWADPFFVIASLVVMLAVVLLVARWFDRLQRERTAAEERFAQAFDSSPLALTIAGLADGRIVAVNETFVRQTGYHRAETLGRTTLELGLWVNPQQREEQGQQLAQGEIVNDAEVRFRMRDGSERDCLLSLSRIEFGGQPCVLSVVSDHTERKRAEEALRQSQQRLALAMDTADIYSWEIDLSSGQMFWSENTNRVLGLDSDRTPSTIAEAAAYNHPDDQAQVRQEMQKIIKGEQHRCSFEQRLVNPQDQSVIWLHVQGIAETNAHGQPVRVIGLSQNITRRKQQELNQQFLLKLSDLIRVTEDAETLLARTADWLGAHLQTTRCMFNEIDLRGESATVRHEYRLPEAASFLGTVSLANYSRITGAELAGGRTVVVNDTQADARTATQYATAYAPEGIGAYLAVPMLRGGTWIGTLWVDYGTPHVWQDWEIELVQTVGERLWLAAEKLRSEQAVRESELRLRLATGAAGMFAWEFDLAARTMKWGENASLILDLPADLLSPDIEQTQFFIHPEDRERHWDKFQQTLAENRDTHVDEYRLLNPVTGNTSWMMMHCVIQRAVDGKPMRVYGVTQDISERKEAEEALRASEERLRLAIETAEMTTWQFNLQDGVRTLGENYAAVVGAAPATADQFMAIVHPSDRERFRLTLSQTLKDQIPFKIEYRVITPAQETRWLASHGRLLRNAYGQPEAVIGVVANITARKQLELEREQVLLREQQARALAEEANVAKDNWLAMVTHELRSPLNAILGHARLLNLRRGQLSPDFADFADLVRRNGERQNELINDLLDTARMANGKLRLESGPVKLVKIINDALDTVRPSALAKDVILLPDIDANAGTITGDAPRLQQVVWNLLTNAIKFTPSGGSVILCLRRKPEQVVLTVSDTGQGITPEFLPHVFDRFSQADTSRSRRYGGLGLGLALVKQIVALHGGTITADSAGTGQGASFVVTLPLRSAEHRLHLQPTSVPSAQITRKEDAEFCLSPSAILKAVQVLLVEDEPDARVLVATILTEQGAEVRTVATAAAAWPLLTAPTRPDILICDIGLPEEDGYSLLARLRKWEQEREVKPLPALALTAHSSFNDQLQALTAGFQMHVAKPVNPEELLLSLKSLIERLRV